MKKKAVAILPILFVMILIAFYLGAVGGVSGTSNRQINAGIMSDSGLSDEMYQIAESFKSIQSIIAAIIVSMILYCIVLFTVLSLILRKRRAKMKRTVRAAKQSPKPMKNNIILDERVSPQAAVKVEGTYIGNKRSGKIDVESFLTQSSDEAKLAPKAAAPTAEAAHEDLEYIEAEPAVDADLDTEAEPVIEAGTDYEPDTETVNLFTEALKHVTGADIAFINLGGIRSSLNYENITEADIMNAFPFRDTVMVQGLTKAQIKAVLEYSVEMLPEKNGRQLSISGIVAELDMTMPKGERVASVTLASGEEMSDEDEYIVAANDYIANGGDGYDMLAALPKMSEGQTVVQAVLEYSQ